MWKWCYYLVRLRSDVRMTKIKVGLYGVIMSDSGLRFV